MCSLWADNYSGGSWMFRLSLPGCWPLWFLLLLSCSVVSNSSKPMECSTPGFLVLDHLPELAQTHVRWVGDVIQPPHPLSSPFPPASVFPSIRVFFSELALPIRWPSIELQHQAFQWTLGLVSFRMDWLDLLAVPGTLESSEPTSKADFPLR